MVTNNAIDSLRRTVQRICDDELKNELLHIVGEVQRDLSAAHDCLCAQRGEIESLKADGGCAARADNRRTNCVYDPPV